MAASLSQGGERAGFFLMFRRRNYPRTGGTRPSRDDREVLGDFPGDDRPVGREAEKHAEERVVVQQQVHELIAGIVDESVLMRKYFL